MKKFLISGLILLILVILSSCLPENKRVLECSYSDLLFEDFLSTKNEIDYTGWIGTTGAGGAGIGCEKLSFTFGAQVTAYRDPEKTNNNWGNHPE